MFRDFFSAFPPCPLTVLLSCCGLTFFFFLGPPLSIEVECNEPGLHPHLGRFSPAFCRDRTESFFVRMTRLRRPRWRPPAASFFCRGDPERTSPLFTARRFFFVILTERILFECRRVGFGLSHDREYASFLPPEQTRGLPFLLYCSS